MFTKKCKAIATLAVCAVALVALGSGKNPVERPLKVHSVNVWTIDLASVDPNTGIARATLHAEGVATHTGRLTVDGAGLWDLSSTATPVGMYVSAGGDGTAANGDHLTWELPGTAYLLEFTGGSGRLITSAAALRRWKSWTWQSLSPMPRPWSSRSRPLVKGPLLIDPSMIGGAPVVAASKEPFP